MVQPLLNLLVLALLTGCVSYPVMEFRGSVINLDGDGQVESGPRELGVQRSGTTGDHQFLGLGFSENSEFRLLYPRGTSLRTVDARRVAAFLIRGPSSPSSATPASHLEMAPSPREIELAGPIRIKFRDNNHFAIGVNLKDKGTNHIALDGEFLAYSQQQFEPMTCVAALPLLFGFGEASFGPARTKTKEGNLGLVRRVIGKLAQKRNSGAAEDFYIVEAHRWITVTKNTASVNPTGIRFSFPVQSQQDAALKARMETVCREMGLNLKVAASRELSDPTTEREPHFLSVDLHGTTADVTESIVKIPGLVFGVTEETRFRVTE